MCDNRRAVSPISQAELYRRLPGTDELLRRPEIEALIGHEGHTVVAESVRAVLARLRREIGDGQLEENSLNLALAGLGDAIERELRRSLSYSLRSVINATGVILHTNMGRAPLSSSVMDHIRETALFYSNLELDLHSGERGKRDVHVDRLFRKLSQDAETGLNRRQADGSSPNISTIVVNNNAAAVLLALNSLADGSEVIVSRGELVEIGGSFRIPDVMAKSNAVLREVGTTNRTRVSDYEHAINENTRLLLRVHRSNFEISGFTEQPALEDLVALSQRRKLPLLEDLGSGALVDLRAFGITGEPGVIDSLRSGVDVVTYSGDKLLGGPQAGLISGRSDLVGHMRSNSLFRALRVDKLTYAALEATLLAYVKRNHDAVPALRMMRLGREELARRAESVLASVRELAPGASSKLDLELCNGESVIGGGAAPSSTLPSRLVAVTHATMSAEELLRRLRIWTPPIIARVEEGRVLLDLRTVFPEQDAVLAAALASASKD